MPGDSKGTDPRQVDLLKKARELSILNRVSKVFLTFPDDRVYGEVLKVVLEELGSSLGLFGYIAADGALVCPSFSYEIWDKCSVEGKSNRFPEDLWGGLWKRALRERVSFHSPGPFRTPEGHLPINNVLFTPIVTGNRPVGLLAVANRRDDFGERDKEVLEWIANQIAPILDARLSQEQTRAEHQQTIQALQDSEHRLREQSSFREAIIERAAEGLCVCHEIPDFPHVAFTVWNPRMTELTGYSMEEINRLGWLQSVYPDPGVQQRAIERMSRMREGFDLLNEEWQITRKDGDSRLVSISTSVLISHDGKANVLALMRDLTERQKAEDQRRKLEERIHHAQKLESLGVLAGGIAHDFNNLLMGVLGNADMALLDLTAESPVVPCLKDIKTAALRLADLTRQMLAYSGKGKFVIESLNLSRMVDEMTHLLEVSIPKKVVIKYDLASEIQPIRADASQVRQVIMNLITNAAEACADKSGVVSLRTGVAFLDPDYIAETLPDQELVEGYYSFLEVSDTGCGMDEKTQNKIFDPFFTTKFTGRGLGLSAVLGIMRGHHGAIKLYSEAGRGSTFKLFFPSEQDDQLEAAAESRAEPAWRGRGTVLIVDDQETVRATTRRMLEKIGFAVITASDGLEAVKTVIEQGSQIDCLLLDFAMPRMDGIETFRELKRLRSDIPVILSSGYNQQDATSHFAGKGLAGFIQKPYSVQDLRDKLREALEGSDSA